MESSEEMSDLFVQTVALLTENEQVLISTLVTKEILDKRLAEELKRETNAKARAMRLIEKLRNLDRGLNLRQVLEDIAIGNLLEMLDILYECEPPQHAQSSTLLTETASASVCHDGHCSSKMPLHDKGSVAIGSMLEQHKIFSVKRAPELKVSDRIYKMSSYPRGFCVIVNNFNFYKSGKTRSGSVIEEKFLTVIFQQLHFQVVVHQNLTTEKMCETFEELSLDKDSRMVNHDALVVIILTHGDQGKLMGSDGEYIRTESIIENFSNAKCKNLVNKPKMFFIQACRGGECDEGVTDAGIPAETKVEEKCKLLPTWSDVLICYATPDGYVSNRDPLVGSWFGNALGNALIKHAWEYDLNTLLLEVREGHIIQAVENIPQVNLEVMDRDQPEHIKQSIEWTCRGLRKLIYFNPGHFEHRSDLVQLCAMQLH